MNRVEDLVEHIKRLESLSGLELYAVGGCLRDLLLDTPAKDYDFTCKNSPDEIEYKLRGVGKRVYTVGKRFGTIGFKDEYLQMVEITTFRTEKYKIEDRKPFVEFNTTLENDLGRRDFTINAMALGSDGKLIDIFNGKEDLENHLIKCVGDPFERFNEDPLRMLRSVRFAVQLDFSIDNETGDAISQKSVLLLSVSKQRIINEIDKMFQCNILVSIALLHKYNLLQVLLPEFCSTVSIDQVIENYLDVERELHLHLDYRKDKETISNLGWSIVFQLATKQHSTKDIYSLLLSDLVTKYSLHFKFSNKRQKYLLENI